MKFFEFHFHLHGESDLKEELCRLEERFERKLMAFKDDVNAAIKAEREQVATRLKELEDKIAGMDSLSDEDKAEILAGIKGIYEPAAPTDNP